jgi:hypothetical protein
MRLVAEVEAGRQEDAGDECGGQGRQTREEGERTHFSVVVPAGRDLERSPRA